ncbi:MAG: GNAT family N-acetyltransferase [Ferruginibacter sp.]|nr:GNAT family N-acetyltransferase [Ferruginibacter sp.]
MQIVNSTKADIETIFSFYDAAISYQKRKFDKHWKGFDLNLVEKEVEENRQYKIVLNDNIVCIFAIAFNDAYIWGSRDNAPSVYIHRIVTHPEFRGNNYVKHIVDWAIKYGNENGKQFVRMDTWGDNQKLIGHYTNCGFTFLGLTDTIMDESLPKHYQGIRLSLFEIALKEYEQPL